MKANLLLVLFILTLILSPLALGEVIPQRDSGEIRSGERASFHFTIFNKRNETLFFVIICPSAAGWELNVTPESGVVLPQGEKKVDVFITAPEIYSSIEKNFVFKIMMYNSTGLITEYEYSLSIILLPKGTFFFFFTLPFPTSWDYWNAFISVILTWAIISIILYLLFPLIKKLTAWTKTKIDDILIDILKKPVALWIILYGLLNASLTLPISSNLSYILVKIYNMLVIIIVTWIIYRIFREVIIVYAFHLSRRKKKRTLENVLIPVIEKVGIVTIVAIGGIMLLQEAGVNVAVLVASMGVAGIIIGLAAQDTLGNFFAGMHILLDRAFEIGDLILIEGEDSVFKVQNVGIRSTKLYDIFSHTMVYIPNSMLANHKIVNLKRPDTKIKIRVDVGVSYGSDVEKVKKILKEIALSTPGILKDEKHEPVVIFKEFGDSSLNFILSVWVENVERQWELGSIIREKILRRFREEGIEIPFPQIDVHVR